jgi:hypothetical protein
MQRPSIQELEGSEAVMNCLSIMSWQRLGKQLEKTGFQAVYCNMKGPALLYSAHEKSTILFY